MSTKHFVTPKWAIVYGSEIVGPFETREEALAYQLQCDPNDLRLDSVRPLRAPKDIKKRAPDILSPGL